MGCKLGPLILHLTSQHTKAVLQTTKDSSPGPGSKPQPKAPSSSSLPQKQNTTPSPSAPTTS